MAHIYELSIIPILEQFLSNNELSNFIIFQCEILRTEFKFFKKDFTKRKANIKRQILSILSKDLDLTFFLRSIQASRSIDR